MNKEDKILKYKELARIEHEKRVKAIKEYWNHLPKFVDENQVPNIPIVQGVRGEITNGITQEEHDNFYIPKLIEAGAIPKNQLVDNTWYYGNFRNTRFCLWDDKNQEFKYWRHKFGRAFWGTCEHFQNDIGYAVFVPIREATQEEIDTINFKD